MEFIFINKLKFHTNFLGTQLDTYILLFFFFKETKEMNKKIRCHTMYLDTHLLILISDRIQHIIQSVAVFSG